MRLPEHIRLRPISTADLPLLQRIYRSTREAELVQLDWTEVEKNQFLITQFDLQHRHYHTHFPNADFQIIRHHEAEVGRFYVDWCGEELRLIDIAMLPEWRGQGIGTLLLNCFLDAADECGKPIALHVEVNNRALSLYQSLGFEIVDIKGVYYKLSRSPRRLDRNANQTSNSQSQGKLPAQLSSRIVGANENANSSADSA